VSNEFARFLKIGQGSLQEMETQLLIAGRLGYIDDVELASVLELADEVGRMLRGLHKSVGRCLTN
jgi:four helix bundle protein